MPELVEVACPSCGATVKLAKNTCGKCPKCGFTGLCA